MHPSGHLDPRARSSVALAAWTPGERAIGRLLRVYLKVRRMARPAARAWRAVAPAFLGDLRWTLAIRRASAPRVSGFTYGSSPLAAAPC